MFYIVGGDLSRRYVWYLMKFVVNIMFSGNFSGLSECSSDLTIVQTNVLSTAEI